MAEAQETELVEEEEVTSVPGWAPTVSLEVQEIRTGEEDEDELYSQRSKLYRFKDGEWKERGLGDSKILRHKVSGKIRYMMRQEKTGKIVANHLIVDIAPYCDLKNQAGSDKTLQWIALDCAEDEQQATNFALKFRDADLAEKFRSAFDGAKTSNGNGQAAKADNGQAASPASPARVVEPPQTAQPEEAEAEENELVEEDEVTIVPGWAPTVTLEPQEVRTGEEEEEEIYSQRSKLYRFKDNDWKERGLGDSKLLRHKGTGKIRYMMRQEKTGKIVANHYVLSYPPYCDLVPNCGSDKTWAWTALDYAEEEQQAEQFALKFKDAELAQRFKEAFESAKAEMAEVKIEAISSEVKASAASDGEGADAAGVGVSPQSESKVSGNNPFAGVSLFAASPSQSSGTGLTGSLFSSLASSGAASSGGLFSSSASSGSWSEPASTGGLFSSATTVGASSGGLFSGGLFSGTSAGGQNTGGGLFSGIAFNANKADSPTVSAESSSQATAPFSTLSFGASSGGMFSNATGGLFSGATGGLFSNAGTGSGLFSGNSSGGGGIFAGLSESSTGGIFGTAASSGSSIFSSNSLSSGGLFNGASGGPSSSGSIFSGAAGGASSGGLFSGASGGGLLGGTSIGSPTAAPAPTPGLWTGATANGAQDDDQYVFEEEVTLIPGWAPSVNLEVKDYVETGEEEEEELYSQRSKLLRYVEGEWKERGTGDCKILRHCGSGKCRFLMRQEKTAKIVANHYIIDQSPYCDLVHNAGNAKIWVWTALDWADEEQKVEKFALRFKTEELAEAFEEAFNAAKSGESAGDAGDTQEDDDWEKAEAYGSAADGASCFAALTAAQASGWRCPGCRLQWGEQVLECDVCQIARPGKEEEVAAAKAEKDAGKQNAMSAFLGTTQSSSSGGGIFGQSSSSTAPATFGFGFGGAASSTTSATPTTVAPSSSASIFGSAAAAPTAGSLFGAGGTTSGSSSSALFGANAPTAATASPATAAATSLFAGVSNGGATAACAAPAAEVKPQSMVPPPPPAMPPAAQDGAGCHGGYYPGYPCAQPFPMAQMQSCMAQMMGAHAFNAAPASAEGMKVEALERSVKELQEKMKEARDCIDTERQERGKVELRLQFLEKRLQEEESRSARMEARVAAVEGQSRQSEGLVEGLRRSMDRLQPDDSRLVNSMQKSLEEQLAPLRQGLEQKASDEMRLLTKVLEQSRDAEASAGLKQRLEAIEARLDRMGADVPLVTMRPPPDRMAYFQGLQVHQSSRSLANGTEDEPRQASLRLTDPKPLMRRIP